VKESRVVKDGRSANAKASHASAKAMVPALVVGWAIIAFGAKAALSHSYDAHPFGLVVHLVAFDLVHDLVIAPAALLVGWAAGRFLPPVARGPVRAALAATALFVVFSYPLVRRWGRRPTNVSTLPLAYGRHLLIIVIAIWMLAALTVVLRVARARPSHSAGTAS
jgi:hypothetical protein